MKGKVLVVSKDIELIEFLEKNLQDNGCRIINTRADDLVLELLDEVGPALLIVDVMMPELDGIELCLGIRQWFEVPVLLLSTWEAGKDRVRRLDIENGNCLTMPMDGTEFKNITEMNLQRNYN